MCLKKISLDTFMGKIKGSLSTEFDFWSFPSMYMSTSSNAEPCFGALRDNSVQCLVLCLLLCSFCGNGKLTGHLVEWCARHISIAGLHRESCLFKLSLQAQRTEVL